MPHPLYVAFIWHQHQPLYKSRVAGSYRLPWVRLHGTKDYLDLVLLLEQYPTLHQTVNLVPSLMLQLEDYASGAAMDPYLEMMLAPTEQLSAEQRQFILQHFFDANRHNLIDPHPRYAELYYQRQDMGQAWCLDHWQLPDYGDLLAWHNLAWFDPLFWDDPDIARWLEQGKGFSLDDRRQIVAKQRELLQRIIPQHRAMQATGQLEITTTPYTHPILPLLADTHAGQVAVPDMRLPTQRFQWDEDIPRHLRKAWDLYSDRFGCDPRGLWPSEQSVSPAILPHVARQGFQWLCSDEGVLGWTLRHFFHRDSSGNLLDPQLLYRPYRLETDAGDLAIVFRDHRLSDLIGFTYGGMEPDRAAADLVGHLETIAYSLKQQQPDNTTSLAQPWLVTIALDGENCWELYAQDGRLFLEALYQSLSQIPDIQLVTVSEFLHQFPPTETLPAASLHSGSWIDANFTTWIGDPAKNRAWDLLAAARQTLANHPEATEASNPDVWEALYAAEGSDWFWWFGEGHSSNQDAMFDQLFREHLCAIYQALAEPIPEELYQPVEAHTAKDTRRPEGYIHPAIDGRGDEQDWDHAGRIEIGGAQGTMHRGSAVQRLWYGYDHLNFYLRMDFKAGIRPGIDCPPELNLFWFYPDQTMHNSPMHLANLPTQAPLNYRFHNHLKINLRSQSTWFQEAIDYDQWRSRSSRVQLCLDYCLELGIPWADMPTEPAWIMKLLLVFSDSGCYSEHLPTTDLISFTVP